MDNSQELKKAIRAVLAEKGDYATLASMLREDEDRADKQKLTNLIEPMSAVADILTSNAKGAFMEDLEKRLDQAVEENTTEMRTELEDAQKRLSEELKTAIQTDRSDLSEEIVARIAEAQANLEQAQERYADAIVNAKAEAMFDNLADLARLTEDEIAQIVEDAALSVESQIQGIIGDYIRETGITTAQITDFREAVQRLIPQFDFSRLRINASQINGLPDYSGAASRIWVEQRLANIPAGGGGSSEWIVVSSNQTASLDAQYSNVANATYTDPTPAEGKGFIVLVRNGTATVGGTGYSTAGTLIYRVYHSGSWANYVYQVSSTFMPLSGGTFTGDISVPAEAYGAGWNGSNEVPTKNDLYDKIETITAGSGISEELAIAYATAL